jgi:hypothetical protein
MPVAASVRELVLYGTSQPAGQTGFSPLQFAPSSGVPSAWSYPGFSPCSLVVAALTHPNLQQQKFNPAPQNKRNHA